MTTPLGDQPDTDLVLCAVGDVMIDLADPDQAFAGTAALLKSADIACGDLEGTYTHRPNPAPSCTINLVTDPNNARHLSKAGFAVMNCATNHILDGGYEGLEDTVEILRGQGIAPVGVGRNLEEARRPALITRKGYTVAVLGYASTFPAGYEARADAPGVAPLRVHTVYMPANPEFWEPEAAATVMTVLHSADLDAFKRDIAQAKEQADLVVVNCHWGSAGRPVHIGDYQRVIGQEAIAAGADVVVGHHQHALRGVEIYQGKPIFYGLGSFALYLRNIERRVHESILRRSRERSGEYALQPRPGYPSYPFHPDYRMTAIARVAFRQGRVANVGLVPCLIQPDGHPEPCAASSEQGGKIVEYFRQISAAVDLETRYEPAGGGSLAGFEAIAVLGPGGQA